VSRPLLTGSALAFIARYVDTVGFVALFGLFTWALPLPPLTLAGLAGPSARAEPASHTAAG
jgi:hypothetical protein